MLFCLHQNNLTEFFLIEILNYITLYNNFQIELVWHAKKLINLINRFLLVKKKCKQVFTLGARVCRKKMEAMQSINTCFSTLYMPHYDLLLQFVPIKFYLELLYRKLKDVHKKIFLQLIFDYVQNLITLK